MARYSHTGILVVVLGFGFLAGCEEGVKFGAIASRADTSQEAAVSGGEAAGTIVEQDVEAPDVFAANESGLWDGRPSLGGVWVAHPEVADPERVIIRNQANGNFVIGALFRRERDNPGPRIQVSSDAAAELGLLAGQPSVLDVVALRREQVEVPAEDGLEDPLVPALEIADVPEDGIAADGEDAPVEVATLQPVGTPDEPKKKKGFLGGLFSRKKPQSQTVIEPAAPLPDADIETASLDPVAAAAVAVDAAQTTAASATAAASAVAAPAPSASASLQQPYIQIGIFSVSENADNTATSLRGAGLLPTVREQEARGKKFWRVIVGPATNAAERRTVLAKVRELGFEDAYYVTN